MLSSLCTIILVCTVVTVLVTVRQIVVAVRRVTDLQKVVQSSALLAVDDSYTAFHQWFPGSVSLTVSEIRAAASSYSTSVT